ncbi:hypothetical protein ACROYT_G036457 [Oculina patagonica]
MGFPSRLTKAQSPIETQRDSEEETSQGSEAPCVDEGDAYACYYYIIMLDACDNDKPLMENLCRFTCNFC